MGENYSRFLDKQEITEKKLKEMQWLMILSVFWEAILTFRFDLRGIV